MKKETKNFDEKIHAERLRSNALAERCQELPKQIAEIEKEILRHDDETQIQADFDRIEALRRSLRETRLLQRRAEIRRLRFVCEKHKAAIEAKRAEWQEAYDKLPALSEARELAEQAFAQAEQNVKRIESVLASEERALQAHEIELSNFLTEKFPLD